MKYKVWSLQERATERQRVNLVGKTTKTIIVVIVFGFMLPLAIILPIVSEHDTKATDLVGIRDYKAGRYDAAILELKSHLNTHPFVANHNLMAEKSDYAQHYLGLALLKQHRYTEAVSVFRVYSQYAAGNEKNYLLGKALFCNGSKAEARTKLQGAVDEEMQQSFKTRDYHLINSAQAMIKEMDQTPSKSSRPNAVTPLLTLE